MRGESKAQKSPSANHRSTRARVCYAIAAIMVVGAGLVWRSALLPLSAFLRKYGGDALWALLIFLLIRFLQPRLKVTSSAVFAFAIAVTVEVGQLCHAPWIEAIRGTRLGALILGTTFNWPDIPAYAAGILAGALLDRGCARGRR